MAELVFKDLNFEKDNGKVKVNFLRLFYFYLDDEQLKKIGEFNINRNSISFQNVSENNARKKFEFLLYTAFKSLKNRLNNKTTVYIHQSSGIPLIGTNYFLFIYLPTNII